MELRQLRQFAVLAETLNFHRAAERLHMAQPPLSTAMRKLEDELGIALFDRDPRGLKLTVAGGIALEHARRTLQGAEELRRAATECATGEQGRLTLGFAGTSSFSLLPRLIPLFQARYPRVELVLRESTTRALIGELADHSVDVALLRTPVFEPCEAELLELERDHFVLAVHANHPLALRQSVSLSALGNEPFIQYSRAQVPAMHALVQLAFRHAGIAPRVVQEMVQVPTAVGLVESGIGLALVPSITARYALTSVRLLPIDGLPDTLDIGIALAHHPAVASGPTQRFVDTAAELLRTPPIG
jgi:DNA-binding transcriptional LysR family regulator